jgi:hypothetical protein
MAHQLGRSAEATDQMARTPMTQFPCVPWRSLGGFLNYENWPERERFLELDRKIRILRAQEREWDYSGGVEADD